ncbi:hypothetical protein J6590_042807 [Homalodisca vitripennis]|nr:hypothetical protein J6590_042807 [Homalodisca vitripennis]
MSMSKARANDKLQIFAEVLLMGGVWLNRAMSIVSEEIDSDWYLVDNGRRGHRHRYGTPRPLDSSALVPRLSR